MEQWDKLVNELLSDHSPKELKESLRALYDSYVDLNEGGINKNVHFQYRAMEKFLEKLPRERIKTNRVS